MINHNCRTYGFWKCLKMYLSYYSLVSNHLLLWEWIIFQMKRLLPFILRHLTTANTKNFNNSRQKTLTRQLMFEKKKHKKILNDKNKKVWTFLQGVPSYFINIYIKHYLVFVYYCEHVTISPYEWSVDDFSTRWISE